MSLSAPIRNAIGVACGRAGPARQKDLHSQRISFSHCRIEAPPQTRRKSAPIPAISGNRQDRSRKINRLACSLVCEGRSAFEPMCQSVSALASNLSPGGDFRPQLQTVGAQSDSQ